MNILMAVLILISLPYWVTFFSSLFPLPNYTGQAKKYPFVSVIVPTRNDETTVERALKSIKNSDYPGRMEIIVVDANSKDRTAKIARKYTNRIIIEKKPSGKPRALNLAMKKARGEVVYFLDADTFIEKSILRKVVLSVDEHHAASGIALPLNKNTFVTRLGRLVYIITISANKVIEKTLGTCVVAGKNFAVKKSAVKKVGGFSDALVEDVNFSIKMYNAGYPIRFLQAPSWEIIPHKFSWFLGQQRRWHSGTLDEVKFTIRTMGAKGIAMVILLGFIGISAIAFLLSVLFILAGFPEFLVLLVSIFIMYVAGTLKCIDADDAVLLPVTITVLGALQSLLLLEGIVYLIKGEKMAWSKTPK